MIDLTPSRITYRKNEASQLGLGNRAGKASQELGGTHTIRARERKWIDNTDV